LNYFSKNLKTLRARMSLSQDQFAKTFGLSKSNVNSYENGAFPKIEVFIRIMNYFNLDPSKFIELDMEKHAVERSEGTPQEKVAEEELSKKMDRWFEDGTSEAIKFQFLETLTPDEIKSLYIKQYRTKEEVIKENIQLKEKYLKLLEKAYEKRS